MPRKTKAVADKKKGYDPYDEYDAGDLSPGNLKTIANGNLESEYFLPFCTSCTDPCCNGDILATESEHKAIVEYSGVDHFEKYDGYYVHEGDPCGYLKKGLCSIHPVRPGICQMYPYSINGDTGEIEKDPSCPAAETLYESFRGKAQKIAKTIIEEMSFKTFLRFWHGLDDDDDDE